MFAAATSPIEQYRRVDTLTAVSQADPHGLVVLLFDGAIAAIMQARHAISVSDIPTKLTSISKAIRIVDEGLKACLQSHADNSLAANLHALYDHVVARLLEANVRNLDTPLEEALQLLAELRDAWMAIAPAGPAPTRLQA
jgi:flagellar secretion chaperone FliS